MHWILIVLVLYCTLDTDRVGTLLYVGYWSCWYFIVRWILIVLVLYCTLDTDRVCTWLYIRSWSCWFFVVHWILIVLMVVVKGVSVSFFLLFPVKMLEISASFKMILIRIHNIGFTIILTINCDFKSKKGGKDQESIQSSTTPDPRYQWESRFSQYRAKSGVLTIFVVPLPVVWYRG